MRLAAALSALMLLTPLAGQAQDERALADTAVAQLQSAALLLDRADTARDRVRALTETVNAYEAALEALRDGLRGISIEEERLRLQLEAKRDRTERLVVVLQSMGKAPAPSLLLHPQGPEGTARAGMMLSDVTPALQAEVAALQADLTEYQDARALRETTIAALEEGLIGTQQARTELSQAIADRTDLPKRFTEDPIKTAVLIASTETLEAFAAGVHEIATGPSAGAVPDISALKGTLRAPVQGTLLRRPGEADAAGVIRPGLILATRPGAVVSTPVAATIRYRGPLLDYGNVMILEPGADTLFVFAGLDKVYGATGEVVPAGHPVGMMGQPADLSANGRRSETLYVEVREDNVTVDPRDWFRIE